MFSSSSDFFSWLSRFINYESGLPPKKSFRLDRMEFLAALAGNPERCAPCIHIAGSKGKGSVTVMAASILEAGGFRAARYMSPHVSDFRERIGLGNSFFDEGVYCAAGEELRHLAEKKLPAAKKSLFDPANEEGEAPTFFELLTLYFFLCARIGKCDAMVVETGMGGRLDCTNIVGPVVSVITLIELEHTAILGKTIGAIAGEKAGIIKTGRPVLIAAQPPEALEVFKNKAAETKSPLYYFPQIAAIENLRITKGGTDFSLSFHENSQWPKPLQLFIPIPGKVQAENASLAAAAATVFGSVIRNGKRGPIVNGTIVNGAIDDDAIAQGLGKIKIPARFEKICEKPPVIIDGAHTPESISLCANTFCSLYGEGGLLLFGCAADKDALSMAGLLLPRFSAVIITTPGAFRISNPEKVYSEFSSDKTVFVKDTGQAIEKALEMAQDKGLPVLCTGSFYLASEIRNYISLDKAEKNT